MGKYETHTALGVRMGEDLDERINMICEEKGLRPVCVIHNMSSEAISIEPKRDICMLFEKMEEK
jgi:hypothetical protein